MKTKAEVAELITLRIQELEQDIEVLKQVGDWNLLKDKEAQLALRRRELEIFK
jgi:hypothetical protein